MDERANDESRHRRRRRRATAVQGPPPGAPVPPPEPAEPPPPRADQGPRRKPHRQASDQQGRGGSPRASNPRGDIAGAAHTQVGVSAALRARDVNRPTDEDLAAAEAELVIVRRNWRPDDAGGPGSRKG